MAGEGGGNPPIHLYLHIKQQKLIIVNDVRGSPWLLLILRAWCTIYRWSNLCWESAGMEGVKWFKMEENCIRAKSTLCGQCVYILCLTSTYCIYGLWGLIGIATLTHTYTHTHMRKLCKSNFIQTHPFGTNTLQVLNVYNKKDCLRVNKLWMVGLEEENHLPLYIFFKKNLGVAVLWHNTC